MVVSNLFLLPILTTVPSNCEGAGPFVDLLQHQFPYSLFGGGLIFFI
jgi:hypothetical protein